MSVCEGGVRRRSIESAFDGRGKLHVATLGATHAVGWALDLEVAEERVGTEKVDGFVDNVKHGGVNCGEESNRLALHGQNMLSVAGAASWSDLVRPHMDSYGAFCGFSTSTRCLALTRLRGRPSDLGADRQERHGANQPGVGVLIVGGVVGRHIVCSLSRVKVMLVCDAMAWYSTREAGAGSSEWAVARCWAGDRGRCVRRRSTRGGLAGWPVQPSRLRRVALLSLAFALRHTAGAPWFRPGRHVAS